MNKRLEQQLNKYILQTFLKDQDKWAQMKFPMNGI